VRTEDVSETHPSLLYDPLENLDLLVGRQPADVSLDQ
jgi:hypothetical protein